MRRTYCSLGLIGACAVAAVVVWRAGPGRSHPARAGNQAPAPAAALPLTQVVLFNNGIGYFQREGEVDGSARVDLSFPATDVNDLIKSLTLHGTDKASAISYDGQEPLERSLGSLALDLSYNPTFGQLLNQARGEKVEVTREAGGATSGTIVGMESDVSLDGKEQHHLNLLTTEGMRRVSLSQVQRVRFLNPALEAEFRRALELLAGAHNSQRRTVSLHLRGEGKRPVKLGYVVESPIWKASYRLALDTKGRPTLQGWAVVDNTSDEDWKDVRLALVSGRPFSFQMNLYAPVFVPRPVIEPEVLASLRPPVYQPSEATEDERPAMPGAGLQTGLNVGFQGGFNAGFNAGFNVGLQGGFQGGLPAGRPGAGPVGDCTGLNRYQVGPSGPLHFSPRHTAAPRLSYEQLLARRQEQAQKRREARERAAALGKAIAEGLTSLPIEDEAGDTYRYAIDQKVSLPRQKSMLLPVLHDGVQATRVSIYNRPIHAKFPLLGLKLKNTTGRPLMQGPLAVFDGGAFAGDSRLPDLKPGEERLLSYALDLGMEVKPAPPGASKELVGALVRAGDVIYAYRGQSEQEYRAHNRSKEDRLLVVSHPVRPEWKVIGAHRPAVRSRDLYRFEWKVPAGTTQRFAVTEETRYTTWARLALLNDAELERLIRVGVATDPFRAALRKALRQRAAVREHERALDKLNAKLREVVQEQSRVRSNLDALPKNSAAHKRQVGKFERLETALEAARRDVRDQEALLKRLWEARTVYEAWLTVR
jgi:hypothetical protein